MLINKKYRTFLYQKEGDLIENLIGKTFNYLTVIDGPIKKENSRKIHWLCQCQCGTQKVIRSDSLKDGTIKSCGCYKNKIFIENNKKRYIDLAGQRFGKLVALEKTNKRSSDGRVVWRCECDCGNICEVDSHHLTNGNTQSCGCSKSKGEIAISNLLLQNNISFEMQKKFDTCRFENNYFARFDFFIDNQYLVEYDGEQHFYYDERPSSWNTKENYIKTQQHDDFKNQWCKNNNIPLIRIPYTKLSTLCLEDLLLETTQFRVV